MRRSAASSGSERPSKRRSTFRAGGFRLEQHGDLGTQFRTDRRGAKTRLVNLVPAANPYRPSEVLDPLGGWSPMPGGEGEGWENEVVEIQIEATPAKRRRYVSSDDPMRLWRQRSGLYLDELMRGEGLGRHHNNPRCAECNASGVQLFRCRDCGRHLQCEDCLREGHLRQPLHRPEVWNGNYWAPCSFFRANVEGGVELRMVYQLGHHGFPCLHPEKLGKGRRRRLVVMDIGGVFEVDVRFCACSDSLLHPHGHVSQLLDNGWYPATTLDPTTCATFRLLDLFRLMKVAGNANANDFVRVLERATDATLTRKVPERYKSFVRMARQWDFLTRAKRAGRGNCRNGIPTTEPGGLAVWCWACPDPARNLPAGWENVAAEEAYLYALILALDANFRLKNRIRTNERHDPSLTGPWGYFVLLEAYKEFLRHYVAENDVSTCIAFQALMQKETRLTTGLRVSGVGGCVCARHGLVRPLGIGDLQKGERYANMDWILLSALNGSKVKRVVLSYDIACQWKQRLAQRALALMAHEEELVKGLRDLAERVLREEMADVDAGKTSGIALGSGSADAAPVSSAACASGTSASASATSASATNASVTGASASANSASASANSASASANSATSPTSVSVDSGLPASSSSSSSTVNASGATPPSLHTPDGISGPRCCETAIRTHLNRYTLQFGLPVWHAAAHDAECQAAMSLSHAVGVGRTDGEGIERTWAILNPIAYSTKEMGEGHRHDTIDDKIDNINFLKNVGQGDTLARKYLIALAARDVQVAEFQEVDASLESWMRRDWQRMLDAWNADNSQPNPEPELEEVRAGRGETFKGKMTGVAFIKAGLQLENAQRRIKAEIKATNTMTAERASQIDELRVSFFKKLRSWQTQQAVFMPISTMLREEEEERRNREEPAPAAEDTKLWLPSDLSDTQRRTAGVRGLAKIEGRLREGQCGDALVRVRGSLQAKHHMVNHRNANAVGQMASTRSNTVIGRIDGQSHRQVLKYRQARAAGRCLEGDAFAPKFLELRDEDVRMGIEKESDAQARTDLGRAGTSRPRPQ
ncbi:CxC2 domain-containing protein [Mycena kentingensis (nom. inval.)]|nr:CxC2 domain-containing protein [Mycena kentingensis (nom. inval.)]